MNIQEIFKGKDCPYCPISVSQEFHLMVDLLVPNSWASILGYQGKELLPAIPYLLKGGI